MKKLALMLATGFYVGYMPLAPGSWATFLGAGIYFLLPRNNLVYFILTIALLVVAVWSADRAEIILGKRDDQRIVIDEIIGFLIALFMLPVTWLIVILGFIIFRILDILKPLGIKKLQHVNGGLGVVADDVAAGLLTNMILRVFIILWR